MSLFTKMIKLEGNNPSIHRDFKGIAEFEAKGKALDGDSCPSGYQCYRSGDEANVIPASFVDYEYSCVDGWVLDGNV